MAFKRTLCIYTNTEIGLAVLTGAGIGGLEWVTCESDGAFDEAIKFASYNEAENFAAGLPKNLEEMAISTIGRTKVNFDAYNAWWMDVARTNV